jgi:putative ABC transport system permease protein
MPFTEITESNLELFHFHGSPATFPLTAILAVAADERQSTLLEANYLDPQSRAQALLPSDVVAELMTVVFRVQRFFDLLALVLMVVTFVLVFLVIMLSLRLRAREMTTMVKIGCSRYTVFWLQAMELVILFVAGLAVAALLIGVGLLVLPQAFEQWIVAGLLPVLYLG